MLASQLRRLPDEFSKELIAEYDASRQDAKDPGGDSADADFTFKPNPSR